MDFFKNQAGDADFQMALPELINQWENDLYAGRVYGFALSDIYKRGRVFQDTSKWPIREIFDNNPSLAFSNYGDVRVLPPDEIKKRNGRILIFSIQAGDIKKQLKGMGLREFYDFMSATDYLSLRSWFIEKKVVLNLLIMMPTLRCTLNCQECNTLIPRHKKSPRTYSLGEMKSDLDTLMSYADYIQFLSLMGGEAFLNPDLADFIIYAAEKYGDRIGELGIPSNGTIAVSGKMTEALKQAKVMVQLSDYGLGEKESYRRRFERTVASLEEANVEYKIRPVSSWFKTFSDQPVCGAHSLSEHFRRCYGDMHCSVFNSNRLLPCSSAFSADLCGWIGLAPGDCLDVSSVGGGISEEDRQKFVMTYLGRQSERGYLSCCEYCYGRDDSMIFPAPLPSSEIGNETFDQA